MKFSHAKLITFSGLIWFAIGIYLLQLGLNLLLNSSQDLTHSSTMHYPLLQSLIPYVGTKESAVLILVVIALFIGYFKGRYALGKSAKRGVERLLTFPNPMHIKNIYSGKYYVLLGAMVGLGMSIKYLGLSHDVRGLIDAIIGSALINGSIVYFRLAQTVKA